MVRRSPLLRFCVLALQPVPILANGLQYIPSLGSLVAAVVIAVVTGDYLLLTALGLLLLLTLAAVAGVRLQYQVDRLQSGAVLRTAPRRRVTHFLGGPEAPMRMRGGLFVKVWNEAAGKDALPALRVVPRLWWADLEGKYLHAQPTRADWIPVDEANESDPGAQVFGENEVPTRLPSVDLDLDRVPYDVVLVEEEMFPVPAATIPFGGGKAWTLAAGNALLVRLTLNGTNVPVANEWWFRVGWRANGEGGKLELTIEEAIAPQPTPDAEGPQPPATR